MKKGQSPFEPSQIDDVIGAICDGLREGIPQSVVLRRNPGFPDRTTIFMWRKNNPELEAMIASAREDGWDEIAFRCRAVAAGDEKNGSSGDVKRDRLIVETDLKLLAKWDPKRYGDRVQVDGTMKHEAADLETMQTQLVTQVTMNPTLRPVLVTWLQQTLAKLEETT